MNTTREKVIAALLACNSTTATIEQAAGLSREQSRDVLAELVARGHATKVITSLIRQTASYAPTATLKRLRGVM